jgi:alanine racemase
MGRKNVGEWKPGAGNRNVCMDMTMLNITGTPVQEGDEVIVFGENLPVKKPGNLVQHHPL